MPEDKSKYDELVRSLAESNKTKYDELVRSLVESYKITVEEARGVIQMWDELEEVAYNLGGDYDARD